MYNFEVHFHFNKIHLHLKSSDGADIMQKFCTCLHGLINSRKLEWASRPPYDFKAALLIFLKDFSLFLYCLEEIIGFLQYNTRILL